MPVAVAMAPRGGAVERALRSLRAGLPVIVLDDPDREDEADLVLAAEFATPTWIAFFIREARGLLCVAMEASRLDMLGLPPMTAHNTSTHRTPFTVSVDAADGSTGVSAADRAKTIRLLIDPTTTPDGLARPGHVFPLRAAPGGLRERRGHSEAAVELCRRAGLYPAAVIAELMNRDGTMTRGAALDAFVRRHRLARVSVEQLLAGLGNGGGPPSAETARPIAVDHDEEDS